MGCCLALAYLASLVRGAWQRVAPAAPVPAAFAPPARRPGPGAVPTRRPYAVTSPPAPPPSPWRPVGRGLVAAGLAWFAVGVVGMHLLGWFAWAGGSAVTDTLFHSTGLWLSATGATLLIVKA